PKETWRRASLFLQQGSRAARVLRRTGEPALGLGTATSGSASAEEVPSQMRMHRDLELPEGSLCPKRKQATSALTKIWLTKIHPNALGRPILQHWRRMRSRSRYFHRSACIP